MINSQKWRINVLLAVRDIIYHSVYTNTHFFYKNHTKTSIISTLARV